MDVADSELQELYMWVDDIPLSRPKRNIARDFSDGVLIAEVLYHFFPKEVQLHNYSAANSYAQKMYNWHTLNSKVCCKLGFVIPKAACDAAVKAQPGAVERILKLMRTKIVELAGEEDGSAEQSENAQHSQSSAQARSLPQGTGAEARHAAPAHRDTSGAQAEDPEIPSYGTRTTAERAASVPDQAAQPASSRKACGSSGSTAAAVPGALPQKQRSMHTAASVDDSRADELQEIVQILEIKARKLEQLVRLKDAKIEALTAKLEAVGMDA